MMCKNIVFASNETIVGTYKQLRLIRLFWPILKENRTKIQHHRIHNYMFLKFTTRFFFLVVFVLFVSAARAQEHRKAPGENFKDAPEGIDEIHKEKHDIKARERQTKATRVYSDMSKIREEKKKLRQFKKTNNREDYEKAKEALKHYKQHLRADRRRNRQMDVFD